MERIALRVLDTNRDQIVACIMQETLQLSSENLMQRLLQQAYSLPQNFLTEGYKYIVQKKERKEQKPQKFLQIGAHISDMEGDFTAGTVSLLKSEGHEVKNFIPSNSAKGAPPLSDSATVAIRGRELQSALWSLGITAQTGNLPDGLLAAHTYVLRESIIRKIQEEQPDAVITHAFEVDGSMPDHHDHDAVGRETVAALSYLAQIGYWKKLQREPPTLYLTTREFGKKAKSRNGDTVSGKLVPVFDYDGEQKIHTDYFLENPTSLVNISSVAFKKFLTLWFHRTQMDGKDYAPLIPAWNRLLGSAAGVPWAEGFYPIYIPGVTSGENILLQSLPENVFYTLEKIEQNYVRGQVEEQFFALP